MSERKAADPGFVAHRVARTPAPAKAPTRQPPKGTDKAKLDAAQPSPEGAKPREIGGPKGPEPTRYGDWERKGICYDF